MLAKQVMTTRYVLVIECREDSPVKRWPPFKCSEALMAWSAKSLGHPTPDGSPFPEGHLAVLQGPAPAPPFNDRIGELSGPKRD